jgi:hypothetical protein
LFNSTWNVNPQSDVFFNLSYTTSEAAFGSLSMMASMDVPLQLFPGGQLPGPGADPGSPLAFHDYDFSEVNEYSRFDLDQLRASLGFNYRITPWVSAFGSISYYDVKDNNPYIEDLTGDVALFAGGFNWYF